MSKIFLIMLLIGQNYTVAQTNVYDPWCTENKGYLTDSLDLIFNSAIPEERKKRFYYKDKRVHKGSADFRDEGEFFHNLYNRFFVLLVNFHKMALESVVDRHTLQRLHQDKVENFSNDSCFQILNKHIIPKLLNANQKHLNTLIELNNNTVRLGSNNAQFYAHAKLISLYLNVNSKKRQDKKRIRKNLTSFLLKSQFDAKLWGKGHVSESSFLLIPKPITNTDLSKQHKNFRCRDYYSHWVLETALRDWSERPVSGILNPRKKNQFISTESMDKSIGNAFDPMSNRLFYNVDGNRAFLNALKQQNIQTTLTYIYHSYLLSGDVAVSREYPLLYNYRYYTFPDIKTPYEKFVDYNLGRFLYDQANEKLNKNTRLRLTYLAIASLDNPNINNNFCPSLDNGNYYINKGLKFFYRPHFPLFYYLNYVKKNEIIIFPKENPYSLHEIEEKIKQRALKIWRKYKLNIMETDITEIENFLKSNL
ncbi:hypothetical protein N9N67_04860 [Bacteriovoracaceae bacterium]|nr:hypothetical protein [Bacteriovoracaceae bacterium]